MRERERERERDRGTVMLHSVFKGGVAACSFSHLLLQTPASDRVIIFLFSDKGLQ